MLSVSCRWKPFGVSRQWHGDCHALGMTTCQPVRLFTTLFTVSTAVWACSAADIPESGSSPEVVDNDPNDSSESLTGGTSSKDDAPRSGSGGKSSTASGGTGGAPSEPSEGTGGSLQEPGPDCAGIASADGAVCCPLSCGTCGGDGCGARPGGGADCCTGPILSSGAMCTEVEAPCVLDETRVTETPAPNPTDPDALYTQTGTDLTWDTIMDRGLIPIGKQSTGGIDGSIIDVNNALIETGPYGTRAIYDNLLLHTVGYAGLERRQFKNWSRWYQEDGNTQIFRLFEGEENVRNSRPLAARSETQSRDWQWIPKKGVWREFTARYTIIKSEGCNARCGIFQAKGNNVDHWSVFMNVDNEGNVWLNHRDNKYKDVIMDEDVLGKPFDFRVRDNGLDYEVYYNGELKGTGQWPRTEKQGFRWGIYVGSKEVIGDVMVFISGARGK